MSQSRFAISASRATVVTPSAHFGSYTGTPPAGRERFLTADATASVAVVSQGHVFLLSGGAVQDVGGVPSFVGHADNTVTDGTVRPVSVPIADITKVAIAALPPTVAEQWATFGGLSAAQDFGIDLAIGEDLVVSSATRLVGMPLAVPVPFGHSLSTSPIADEGFRTSFGALSPGHEAWITAVYYSSPASAEDDDVAAVSGPVPSNAYLTAGDRMRRGATFPRVPTAQLATSGMAVTLTPVAPPLVAGAASPYAAATARVLALSPPPAANARRQDGDDGAAGVGNSTADGLSRQGRREGFGGPPSNVTFPVFDTPLRSRSGGGDGQARVQRPGALSDLSLGGEDDNISALQTGGDVGSIRSVPMPTGVEASRLFYKLMLSSVIPKADGGEQVILPTLSTGFDQFLGSGNAASGTRLHAQLRPFSRRWTAGRAATQTVAVLPPVLSNAFATFVQYGTWGAEGDLFDGDNAKSRSITVQAFLPPPGTDNQEWEAYVRRIIRQDEDDHHGQHEQFLQKRATDVFVGGALTDCRDVATAIANILMFFAWMLGLSPDDDLAASEGGGPLLYGYLETLFQLLFHSRTKRWEEQFRGVAPHLPHSLLSRTEDIVKAIVSQAMDPEIQLKAAQQEAGFDVTIPISIFDEAGIAYKEICDDVAKAIKSKNLGPFLTPAADFVPAKKAGGRGRGSNPDQDLGGPRGRGRDDEDRTDREGKRQKNESDGRRQGWLGSAKVCHPPREVIEAKHGGTTICFRHAFVGEACRDQRCTKAHCGFSRLPAATKRIIEKWIASTHGSVSILKTRDERLEFIADNFAALGL